MFDRWNIAGFDRASAVMLVHAGFNPLPAVLLASRGLEDPDRAREFLSGGLERLSDPLTMADMDKAAFRVRRAIENRERVAVYGDYDVDGITASCLVAGYLRSKNIDCDIYIPQRLEEGYGVKSAALDTIKGWGASLVITVDCGITAVEEAEHAKKIGLDLVITDHHQCGDVIPDCLAAVDPKRPDCPSTAKDLAGVGVAFKLICAVEGPNSAQRLLESFSDLVATGTIADVMPVTGENRVLIKTGLESLRQERRPGLAKLRAASGLEGRALNVSNVGFAIAPRINAAGRLGSTGVAVELLTTRDLGRAGTLADELCAMNRERQRIEGDMYKEALDILEKDPPEGRPIVLASRTWHQGVCGIVASRLSERFGLPTVMIHVKDGVGRGSCRSVGGFNLYDALSQCRDVLLGFGGHEMAAGLTVSEDKVDDLRRELARVYGQGRPRPERVLDIDLQVIKPELLTIRNVEALDELEPYGPGNPQPVLCMKNMLVENLAGLSDGKHTKLWLSLEGHVFEAVFFSKSPEELDARVGGRVDVAFTPQINEFRGRRAVQLMLCDLIKAE